MATTISGEDFEIGSTCASELDLEINNISGSYSSAAFQGATVTASIGVQRSDLTYEYCPLGVFYVDSVNKTETSIQIKCYDAIVLMETLYVSTLTYPATLLQIAQDIATKAGLTLANITFPNASFSVATKPNLAGVTLRSAISWVAEAAGCFVRIDRSGKLDINFYASSGQSITAQNYFTLLHDDLSRAAITQVVIQQASGGASVSQGTAGNTYTITGNPLLVNNPSGALTAIYNQLHNFTYMPFNADWQGNPAFMAGDAITITDRNNNSYSTILTECDITYEGGLKGTAAALSLTSQAQTFQTSTAVADAVNSVVVGQQTINNLLAGNITAMNIAAGSLTADRLQAGTITASSGVIANAAIGTAQIVTGSITNALIGMAAIGSANIQNGAITNALIGSAVIGTANIQTAAITNALIGSAAIATANIQNGAITSAQIANATIGSAQIANATITSAQIANGAIGTAQIANGAITTALIANAAITSTQIASASITSANIASLSATLITTGTLNCSNLTVTNLNCASLTVGTINGAQITPGAIGATQLATTINNVISTAQTTANGKNTAFYTSSTPTATAVNDLWFNTANGYQLSVWNGTSWVVSKFGNLAVQNLDAATITTGSLAAARIAAGTITATMIAANTITASQIAAGTITGTQIAATTITASNIVTNSITAAQLAANTITANQIAANTITAGQIAAGTITATQIAAGTITGTQIAANSITSDKINVTNLYAQRIEAPDNKFYATVSTFSSYMNGGGTYSYDALQIYDVTANDSVYITPQGLNFTGTYDIYSGTTWASPFLGVDLNFYQNNSYPGTAGYNGFQFNAYGGQDGSAYVYSTILTVDGVGGMTATTSAHGTTQTLTFTPSGGLALSGKVTALAESHFSNGTFTDPASGTTCGAKVSGNFAAGGVITPGQIYCPGTTYPHIYGNGTYLVLNLSNETTSGNGVVIGGGVFRSQGDAVVNLGASNHRWATIYASTGTINTSDRTQKNTIKELDNAKALDFILALNPVSYKYNAGTSGRTHYGMVAQDVEDEMTALGMTSLDFAGFIKTPTEEGGYIYGLRYEEFISPLIKTVQYLYEKVKQFEGRTAR
jgi:hypothetical protein